MKGVFALFLFGATFLMSEALAMKLAKEAETIKEGDPDLPVEDAEEGAVGRNKRQSSFTGPFDNWSTYYGYGMTTLSYGQGGDGNHGQGDGNYGQGDGHSGKGYGKYGKGFKNYQGNVDVNIAVNIGGEERGRPPMSDMSVEGA